MTTAIFLCLHVFSVVVWVGGMAALHYAVRPAATVMLPPPQRLPLMAAILGRFFVLVALSVVVLLITGFGMIRLGGGFAQAHWTVHAMTTVGLIMMVLFVRLLFRTYPALREAVESEHWSNAAACVEQVRRTVIINLFLGFAIIALVTIGRATSIG